MKNKILFFLQRLYLSWPPYTSRRGTRLEMGKKKKKSGKLAKMTEEERILYLEQQRLAEEEMRKKKEDMLTQFLKVAYPLQYKLSYKIVKALSYI